MPKLSKESVNYSKGMPHSHCGPTRLGDPWYCRHFIGKTPGRIGACRLVEGGIQPEMWCKKWSKVKEDDPSDRDT